MKWINIQKHIRCKTTNHLCSLTSPEMQFVIGFILSGTESLYFFIETFHNFRYMKKTNRVRFKKSYVETLAIFKL